MRRRFAGAVLAVLAALGVSLAWASWIDAQQPRQRPNGGGQRNTAAPPPRGDLPEDSKVLDLYIKFVNDAEKIAKEYEAAGKTEQARAVYMEILKLLPNHKPSQAKLGEMKEKEAKADKKTVDVQANKGWQETGVYTIPGKPLKITATGNWTCKVNQQVGPDGLKVSEELKGLNLGSLVGVIFQPPERDKDGKPKDAPKPVPFAIGSEKEMLPQTAGKLMLRIYDIETADNNGKLKVEIIGTFERK